MKAGVILIQYIIPMLLGGTFDWFTSQVGVLILPQSDVENPIEIQRSVLSSDFRLIRNERKARHVLGVGAAVSLRVKAGLLTMPVIGDYLKDVQRRDNYVEILVTSKYETLTETLHGSVGRLADSPLADSPVADEGQQSPSQKHYVRSITYGGKLIASMRFYGQPGKRLNRVRSSPQSDFSASAVEVGVERDGDRLQIRPEYNRFKDQLRQMISSVTEHTGSLGLSIEYYSTVSGRFVPQDIEGFLSLLETFPSQVAKLNGGKGAPLLAELVPLDRVSARLMARWPNRRLETKLEDMDDKFSDLLLTHQAIRDMTNHNESLSHDCQVQALDNDIDGKIELFKDVIRHLNTATPSDLGAIRRALQAYGQIDNPKQEWAYFKKFQHILGQPRDTVCE